MGFYGNAKASLKTSLQIDRHYPNRAAMDEECEKGDGVYAGRYVMIEYSLLEQSGFILLYQKNTVNGYKYYDNLTSFQAGVGALTTFDDGVIYNVAEEYVPGEPNPSYALYVGDKNTLRKFSTEDMDKAYFSNYLVDKKKYASAGRGYDSTIWQKIYDINGPKYINVAELNSVVPSFGVKSDPPSQIPNAPHFDKNLTNIYYDLHVQPAWGFRIKKAADAAHSDATTKHYNYNAVTDEQASTSTTVNAAIYFNRDAFASQVGQTTIHKKDSTTADEIAFSTAQSGRYYNVSETAGSTATAQADDIQELSISLPAIGNMMSDAWDIIHGPKRDNSDTESLQGRLNFFKGLSKNVIPVASAGSALVGATLSGDSWINTVVDADNKKITVTHKFTAVTGTDTSADMNSATTNKTIDVPIFTVDSKGHVTSKNTHTITLPYGFKTIKPGASSTAVTDGTSNTTSAVADGTQDTLTITPSNKWVKVGGNSSSDIIYVGHQVNTITTTDKDSTALDGVGEFTVQDFTIDEAGHVTANQAHKYTLPHAVRNIKVDTTSSAVTAGTGLSTATTVQADSYKDTFTFSPQNRWVTMSVNTSTDTITFGHAAAGEGKTTAGDTTAAAPAFGADFTVPYVKYDEMGHIVSKGTRKVTIPKGSLVDGALSGTTANVLTSIGFTPSTGEITTTHSNIGSLLLTGHSAVNTDSSYIQPTDSIQAAFGKIDTRLDSEITRAKKAESDNATAIATEKTRAEGAEATLSNTLSSTASAIRSEFANADSSIRTDFDNADKTIRADFAAADTALDAKITAEASRADAAEKVNAGAIVAEQTRAEAAEKALSDKIDVLANSPEGELDSVVELIAWVNEHGTEASAMAQSIEDIKTSIGDLGESSVADTIASLEQDITTLNTKAVKIDAEINLYTSEEELIASGTLPQLILNLYKQVAELKAYHPTEEPTE